MFKAYKHENMLLLEPYASTAYSYKLSYILHSHITRGTA